MRKYKLRAIEIKDALLKYGLRYRFLADKMNVSESLISAVIRGAARSQRVEDYLTKTFPRIIARYPFPKASFRRRTEDE